VGSHNAFVDSSLGCRSFSGYSGSKVGSKLAKKASKIRAPTPSVARMEKVCHQSNQPPKVIEAFRIPRRQSMDTKRRRRNVQLFRQKKDAVSRTSALDRRLRSCGTERKPERAWNPFVNDAEVRSPINSKRLVLGQSCEHSEPHAVPVTGGFQHLPSSSCLR